MRDAAVSVQGGPKMSSLRLIADNFKKPGLFV